MLIDSFKWRAMSQCQTSAAPMRGQTLKILIPWQCLVDNEQQFLSRHLGRIRDRHALCTMPTTTFFTLPAELRQQILFYCFNSLDAEDHAFNLHLFRSLPVGVCMHIARNLFTSTQRAHQLDPPVRWIHNIWKYVPVLGCGCHPWYQDEIRTWPLYWCGGYCHGITLYAPGVGVFVEALTSAVSGTGYENIIHGDLTYVFNKWDKNKRTRLGWMENRYAYQRQNHETVARTNKD